MTLNGYLMSRDTIVANIQDGTCVPLNEKLLPLFFRNSRSFASWLESRAIDAHRTNSRLLKKALRLTTAEDTEVALKVFAATVTDTYWFKPTGSNLTYDNVRFNENLFDKLALYGDPDSFNNTATGEHTPELTNIGSFEKCWRIIDGKWWIYKSGNELELFSELFISELGKALGFNVTHYEMDGKYIRSRDFTGGAKVNYEPAAHIVGKDEDYSLNYIEFKKLSADCAKDYIKMIYLDSLCFNMDRHTNNYGVLRDVENGRVLGMAPNFDNNIALVSRGYPKNLKRENDFLLNLFTEFLLNNEEAMSEFSSIKIPIVDKATIESCLTKIPVSIDKEFVSEFILNGQNILLQSAYS